MKKLTVISLLLTVVLLTACSGKDEPQPEEEQVIDTIPMMVMQIRKCSKLYTAEYKVHKIVTHDDQMKLKGTFLAQDFDVTLPIGRRRIAIPMDATLKAYVDFNGFSEKNVRRHGNKIEVLLPDPKVELTSSKINHAEIKKYVSLLRGSFTDEEMTGYENQGRASIIADVPKMGIIEMAQENAANTLIPMIEALGYKQEDITITFRKQFSVEDLPALLDTKSFAK